METKDIGNGQIVWRKRYHKQIVGLDQESIWTKDEEKRNCKWIPMTESWNHEWKNKKLICVEELIYKLLYFLQEKEVLRYRHGVEGVEGVTGLKNKQGIELAL